jgi:hypothetical protein
MGYSAKIKIDSKRPKKDKTCMIFLQVIINRQKVKLDLGISWPANKFHVSDYCRPRHRNDEDVEEYNVIIRNALSKANSIHKRSLLRELPLTLQTFVKDFRSNLNKSDFIKYFEQQSFRRYNKGIIKKHTYKLECTVLRKLKLFVWYQDPENKNRPEPEGEITTSILPFNEFNNEFAREFDLFLKRQKCAHNTRWGYHKIVITYLNMAGDPKGADKIVFDNPYEKFKNKTVESSRGPLDAAQLKRLIDFYQEWKINPLPILTSQDYSKRDKSGILDDRNGLTGREVVVLRKFLFSCNSSLRISDLQKLDESQFINGEMSITPHKTEVYGTKIKSVPLNQIARMLLDDEIAFVKMQMSDKPYIKIQRTKDTIVRIFQTYTDQACNRYLKRIALKADLNVHLHMHVGRYTFGTLSDEAGANHTALMKQMGIRKRETLEKYVKTTATSITSNVENFNSLLKNTPVSGQD